MSLPKVYFQTNDDSSFKITFTDNQRYLNNGEVVFPKNSLGYIVDESSLITLVKPTGDPYISFKITDTQFANLAAFEEWFAENAVGGTGGSVDPEQLAGLIADAEYISSASTIAFYNLDGDEVCHLDAEPFITDGMVDNVQISGSNLVITFNVDAGKQPISIPLTDIFNPSNYYDKSATDTLLNGKVAVSDYNTYTAATNTALNGKADTSAVTAVSDALSGKQDTLLFYSEEDNTQDGSKDGRIETTTEDTENGIIKSAYVGSSVYLAPSANLNAYTEVSNNEESYQKSAEVYAETDGGVFLNYNAQDNIENTYYDGQLNINGNGIILIVDNGEDIVNLNVTTDGVDIDGDAVVTESMLDDYATVASLSGKADTSAVTAVADALSGKQDTLIAGSGITISGNVISADGGGGSITIDPTLDSGSTNAVANSAITDAFNVYTLRRNNENGEVRYFYVPSPSQPYGGEGQLFSNFSINGRCPLTKSNGTNDYIDKFSLVETSAFTQHLSDYDEAQRVTATALNDLNDRFGGMTLRKLTQAQYDALTVKDDNTLYIITNVVNNA